jgi:hypothetical protein
MAEETHFYALFGVKPLIQQLELRTYTKLIPFKEKVPSKFQGMLKSCSEMLGYGKHLL